MTLPPDVANLPDLPNVIPLRVLQDALDACPYWRRIRLSREVARHPDGRINLHDDRTAQAMAVLLGGEVHAVLKQGPWDCNMNVNDVTGAAFVTIESRHMGRRVLSIGPSMGEAAAAGLLTLWAALDGASARIAARPLSTTPAEA